MPVVAGFNLTPVKSTALQRPDEIDLRVEGAVGDRRFLFVRVDPDGPHRLSGVSKASLMPIRTTYWPEREQLELNMPGTGSGAEAIGVGEPMQVQLYDREVSARWVHEAFEDFVQDVTGDPSLFLMRVDEPEYAGGTHRASIVSRASIREVGLRAGDEALDPRRFRMLIEVDDCEPYEEDSWQGKRVRFGEAILRIGDRMPRCVMTTLDPDTGKQNAPVLDALAQHRKVGSELLLGVYGDVERPGRVRVGDPIETLD
ncbi:MAG TPA: MOSC domain-containing protein [Actinomycetota bacterium]|nr:MOSC domain-containing protein [Actinomycetota bacterium]